MTVHWIILYTDVTTPTVDQTNKTGMDDLLFWIISILCSQVINSYNESQKLGYQKVGVVNCQQSNNLNNADYYDNQCLKEKQLRYPDNYDNVPELFLITNDTQKLHDCNPINCKNLFNEASILTDLQVYHLPHIYSHMMDTRLDYSGILNEYITHYMRRLIESFIISTDEKDRPVRGPITNRYIYNDTLEDYLPHIGDIATYDNINKIPIETASLTPFKRFMLLVRYLQNVYYGSFTTGIYSLDTTKFVNNII
jgi:hypothetical protein